METETTVVRTADGRELCVESGGDLSGRPVLVHGGTPNSRHLEPHWLADAAGRGIHLISYDRPGYGRSTPQPGRTIADCAADVSAIAGAFGIERLGVWGYSGGGPHALACAACLPDLVAAVAVLASVAPYGAPGLDFFSGMGQDNVEGFQLVVNDPAAARVQGQKDREELMAARPEDLMRVWATLLSPADALQLTGDLASFFLDAIQDGLAPGDEGWWEDGTAEMSDWGFALEAIAVPVQLWHGSEDRFVPFQHGQWLAQHVPGVEAHLTDEDGHLTLLALRVPEIHDWILRHL